MITLYTFGPAFGLPDPSPFVMKTEVLLKMSGLPYQTKRADVRKAPKKKLPFIRDADGSVIADSTLIRFHLERIHGIDFDAGLSAAERGIAWAVEKLAEDHLYWVAMRERWLNRKVGLQLLLPGQWSALCLSLPGNCFHCFLNFCRISEIVILYWP